MTTIKSDKAKINAPAERVYDKLSDLSNLQAVLDQVPADSIPADKRQMFENVKITADTIAIPAGPVGEIKMRVTDRMPYSLIQLTGEGTPVPMNLQLEIEPDGAEACTVQVAFHLEIPAMLKPMVHGPLKKVADQFVQVMGSIPFHQ